MSAGSETPMIGADMVVGRVANGVPQVREKINEYFCMKQTGKKQNKQ
jgi:hypothetical protein